MILLDTNVVSALMTPRPAPAVVAWFDARSRAAFAVSAVSWAELRFGLHAMPKGRRKAIKVAGLHRLRDLLIGDRVLPVDEAVADLCALRRSTARGRGEAVAPADALIAATALARGLPVATRDAGPFRAMGCDVLDPWAGPQAP